MDLVALDRLISRARSGKNGLWPIEDERPVLTAINTWVALREGDKDTLKRAHGWPADRAYRVDPLAERISDSWGHYLFGQDPIIRPANDADAALLEDLIERDLPSELERAAGLAVSEGETWARVYVNEDIAPRPLLEWHSRVNVFPLWAGPRLLAAALVTELPDPSGDKKRVYRHFECHVTGGIANVLFRGRADRIGDPVNLDELAVTADLPPTWEHGLPGLLLERIPNRLRKDRRIGVSDYAGILDFLLDLNEAAAIGAHNARLTARKRVVLTTAALDRGDVQRPDNTTINAPKPRFDPTEEVFIEDPLDVELGRAGASPIRVLEYDFDAAALIAWRQDLVEAACTRVGLAVQYAGVSTGADGYAMSGTALRLKLIPTDATGRGKARHWDDALPRILSTMQALDALQAAGGGFGRPWTAPLELPNVERQPGLPRDEVEDATLHSTLTGARIESRWQAIRERHPTWTDEQVDEELGRIDAEQPSPSASMFPGA